MAKPDLLRTITTLSRRIDLLISLNQSLSEKVEALEKENETLKKQHLLDVERIVKEEKNVEFLSLSHRLADSPQALIEARTKIASLIRTIDSCIRILKEN